MQEDIGKTTDRERLIRYIRSHSRNGQARVTHSSVPAREITLAHIIGISDRAVYHNLGLDIGFHGGNDPRGSSIGILHMTPPETVVIAADISTKTGEIDLSFMDRFSGALIITGPRADVTVAIEECVRYFRDELRYTVCPISDR